MKVLCEFKKADSAHGVREWTFGFSQHDLTGENSPYQRFVTRRVKFDSAVADFSDHIRKTYGRKVVGFSILRRGSVKEIGVGQLVVSDKGGEE